MCEHSRVWVVERSCSLVESSGADRVRHELVHAVLSAQPVTFVNVHGDWHAGNILKLPFKLQAVSIGLLQLTPACTYLKASPSTVALQPAL
jgi:hypothetical protein